MRDMLGTQPFVLCREVVLFRRLFCIEIEDILGRSFFGVSSIGGGLTLLALTLLALTLVLLVYRAIYYW